MIYAIAVVLVLIVDQAVKLWTTQNIPLGAIGDECVTLIKGFVHLTNVHNYGAAFSILQNARWLLVGVTAVFVIVVIVLINREIIHTRFGTWTAVLVLAGAIGNCLDRVLYGYVVDMFEFEFSLFGKPFSFPVFNVADIFITVAGVLFCIHLILHNEPEEVKAANEPEFIRRRREARRAKEAPYENIPKRGEHVTLDEELRSPDPDNPFSEWGVETPAQDPEEILEEVIDQAAEAAREPAASDRSGSLEMPVFEDRSSLFDSFLFDSDADPAFFQAMSGPAEETGKDPAREPDTAPVRNVPDSFSLEDILAEFGEL